MARRRKVGGLVALRRFKGAKYRIEMKLNSHGAAVEREYQADTLPQASKFVRELAESIGHGTWSHTSYFEYRIVKVLEVGNALG